MAQNPNVVAVPGAAAAAGTSGQPGQAGPGATAAQATPPPSATPTPAPTPAPAPAQAPASGPTPVVPGASRPATPVGPAGPVPGAYRTDTRPLAGPARPKRRHLGVAFAFLMIVLVPLIAAGWYLYTRAQDQYVSYVAFSVRSEDVSAAMDVLGGLTALGTGSSSDTDILYEFIQSQGLVRAIDAQLDLRSRYATGYERDPVFAFDRTGTIEDLTEYWNRMVRIFYDSGTGLIELRVHAFTAEDANLVATAIVDESTKMINELSAIAREDATGYAREELDRALERLREARQVLTTFRSENRIVDPEAEIVLQTGLLTALEEQLSNALIEQDLLLVETPANDPRLIQAQRRTEVIRARIEEERTKIGATSGEGTYAQIVGEFEGLAVDREFAEQSYVAARAAYDVALAEAQRQSRYLAAYIKPTLAERAEYPQRLTLMAVLGMFLFFAWAIATLIFYAVRDRR